MANTKPSWLICCIGHRNMYPYWSSILDCYFPGHRPSIFCGTPMETPMEVTNPLPPRSVDIYCVWEESPGRDLSSGACRIYTYWTSIESHKTTVSISYCLPGKFRKTSVCSMCFSVKFRGWEQSLGMPIRPKKKESPMPMGQKKNSTLVLTSK